MAGPVIIPNLGYDAGYNALLAIAITGMGFNFGKHVYTDPREDTFFDDEVIEKLNLSYIRHDLTLNDFMEKIREHFDDRGGAWGWKMTSGLNLLPIYRFIFQDMRVVYGQIDDHTRIQNIILKALEQDSYKSHTMCEAWDHIEYATKYVEYISKIVPTATIPIELFERQRNKALSQLAFFLGGSYDNGAVAKMVDSAQRKLFHVFSEKEIGSGYVD